MLMSFQEVRALPNPWGRSTLNVGKMLAKPNGAAFIALEDDVIDLIKRAEEKNIAIDVTNTWIEEALKL